MNIVGDIGGKFMGLCWAVSWVVHYFSNSFLKLARNEYCLRKKIKVSGHIDFEHILLLRVSLRYLNLKLILKCFQNRFITLAHSELEVY